MLITQKIMPKHAFLFFNKTKQPIIFGPQKLKVVDDRLQIAIRFFSIENIKRECLEREIYLLFYPSLFTFLLLNGIEIPTKALTLFVSLPKNM